MFNVLGTLCGVPHTLFGTLVLITSVRIHTRDNIFRTYSIRLF